MPCPSPEKHTTTVAYFLCDKTKHAGPMFFKVPPNTFAQSRFTYLIPRMAVRTTLYRTLAQELKAGMVCVAHYCSDRRDT